MQSNIWPPYWSMSDKVNPITINNTQGCFIYDDRGNKIFDGISSWWSMCHGYKHPKIISNMKQCLNAMPHVMFAGITHQYAKDLAKKLCDFSLGNFQKTFFCDSGSVAVEVAIKMALQYYQERKNICKTHILTFSDCYHGETFMASNLSSDETSPLSPYINNVINIKLPQNSEEMRTLVLFLEKNHRKIACSIIEPLMQGASGIKMYGASILRDIFNAIKKYDITFIVDECATGFYRTGRRFAFDHAEISPDIIVLGKALAGGHISLAGVTTNNKIFSTICTNGHFRHGPTFMANPLACSAGIASLDIFNTFNYSNHIKEIEGVFNDLKKRLKINLNLSARSLGAIIAVDLNPMCDIKGYIAENISTLKLWVRPIGRTLYMMPPLNVEIEDLLFAVQKFEVLIRNVHKIL
ncbi:MAG: adenosylmethionine-8-amino-7-oxononanoate aminotransferase [Candidatus Deianiraeaceae bacterium]|jgi:adenosylmethionine-8-amino-7-oxononanoate aminotransferase